MEVVKETKEYKIVKKRNGRYGIKNAEHKWVNGSQKIEILVKEGLIKEQAVKKEEPPAAEEAPAAEAEAPAAEETPKE